MIKVQQSTSLIIDFLFVRVDMRSPPGGKNMHTDFNSCSLWRGGKGTTGTVGVNWCETLKLEITFTSN